MILSCLNMVRVMVFNTTFNNVPVTSWQSVLLVEETGVPGAHHLPVASHWQTWSHNVVSSTPRHELDSNSQCYTITTTMAPLVEIPLRLHLLIYISYVKTCHHKLDTDIQWWKSNEIVVVSRMSGFTFCLTRISM